MMKRINRMDHLMNGTMFCVQNNYNRIYLGAILYINISKYQQIYKIIRGLRTQIKGMNLNRLDDSQIIGRFNNLLMTSDASPGSIFMLPHGTRIYNKLLEFMKIQCKAHGYQEVRSPMIYKKTLWNKSGHWDNYKDEMFEVRSQNIEENNTEKENYLQEEYGLKPMNCPGHCLIYSSMERSYRDLPIRYTDFGALHRSINIKSSYLTNNLLAMNLPDP